MVQDGKKEIFKRKNPKSEGGPQEKLKDTTETVFKIYDGPLFWMADGGGCWFSSAATALHTTTNAGADSSPPQQEGETEASR